LTGLGYSQYTDRARLQSVHRPGYSQYTDRAKPTKYRPDSRKA